MSTLRRSLPLALLAVVPLAFAPACGGGSSTFVDDPHSNGPPDPEDGGTSGGFNTGSSGMGSSGAPIEIGCGNGLVETGEVCDDGNQRSGDGCSEDCTALEPGFDCSNQGVACVAVCGDGVVVGDEECDDGNLVDAQGNPIPGCSATCQLEDGFHCPTPGEACVATVCGDGLVQGTETCDDGNDAPYDGCFNCQLEPVCNGAGCTGTCGDGVLFPGEECDDGNKRNGDGCSSTCTLEPGFECVNRAEGLPDQLVLPALYRDFKSPNNPAAAATVPYSEALNPAGHPDFERMGGYGLTRGLVKDRLGADGRPVFNDQFDPCVNGPDAPYANSRFCKQLTGADEFHEWFHDDRVTNGVLDPAKAVRNSKVVSTLTLDRLPGTDSYQFDSNKPPYAPFSFFPIDGRGFGNETGRVCRDDVYNGGGFDPASMAPNQCTGARIKNEARCANALDQLGQLGPNNELLFDFSCVEYTNEVHNFLFTSELHFWFTYTPTAAGGTAPKLAFSGDDDVWIFINGRLVVDLGGLHAYLNSEYELTNDRAQQLGLQPGGVYDIALFHAERRSHASNFKFTLGGFIKARTFCESVCGDGIKTANEVCDDGVLNGQYNRCGEGCVWGPRCGDGILQPEFGEECDDGNLVDGDGCSPACKDQPVIH